MQHNIVDTVHIVKKLCSKQAKVSIAIVEEVHQHINKVGTSFSSSMNSAKYLVLIVSTGILNTFQHIPDNTAQIVYSGVVMVWVN